MIHIYVAWMRRSHLFKHYAALPAGEEAISAHEEFTRPAVVTRLQVYAHLSHLILSSVLICIHSCADKPQQGVPFTLTELIRLFYSLLEEDGDKHITNQPIPIPHGNPQLLGLAKPAASMTNQTLQFANHIFRRRAKDTENGFDYLIKPFVEKLQVLSDRVIIHLQVTPR
ncbi:hypothetical protein B9Q03_12645 [Candidatus Marsarchaeota G2 archaeon OSP_D]|uniref:Uncharacterized protein n=1 Tax=Candidatus Marsarchaeota G2 archaeon OSP_D TaxID=1978157 RepID=A0A2R6AF53_9ARCH|nr:MAG: hypothetical protein B9Q03_12645 [Candidatus Marsarchaeota G2 archaeon OSP_D]